MSADLAEITAPAPDDVVLHRWHGVGPMDGTDLNPVLRNLGATTIVGVD